MEACMSSLREINEYLFYEFGFDPDDAPGEPSDTWPFTLMRLGVLPSRTTVYEFLHDDDEFVVLDGASLNFLPKQGLSMRDLELQEAGAAWVAAQEPIDINTSRLGDDAIPSVLQRKERLRQLTAAVSDDVALLEGLYLAKSATYLALVAEPRSGRRFLVGTGIPPILCPDRRIAPWRELSIQIGEHLERDKRGPGVT